MSWLLIEIFFLYKLLNYLLVFSLYEFFISFFPYMNYLFVFILIWILSWIEIQFVNVINFVDFTFKICRLLNFKPICIDSKKQSFYQKTH